MSDCVASSGASGKEDFLARQIVECVPNFSEGRRQEIVDPIVAAIQGAAPVQVLDVQMDADHNRSVVSFVGDAEAVSKAAFAAVDQASKLINLEDHEGEHPRMGAADVVPFVPIAGVTMEACVELATEVGQRIGEELAIPVYLYEEAATRPDRQNLADVRRGEYEGIKDEIETNPDQAPDYGPARMGTAGATAVGARPPLIAYNVNLGTGNVEIAKRIAQSVRHSGGGLRYVKALGFAIEERGIVQVSMNLTNYAKSPLFRTFDLIRREAERYGVPVVGSEIVGLTPANALFDTADHYLRLEAFDRDEQVLENRLSEGQGSTRPDRYLNDLASGEPTPGGGSAAAISGAMAASLVHMVAELTVGREKYAGVEATMTEVRDRASGLKAQLTQLSDEDRAAFESVMGAFRMPKDTDGQNAERWEAIQDAFREAIRVPLETARAAVETLQQAYVAVEHGNPNAGSDAGTAAHLALAAVRGAAQNVEINADSLQDEREAQSYRGEIRELDEQAQHLVSEIQEITPSRM